MSKNENYELGLNEIVRSAYYLGHKKVRGKKDPDKTFCFVDLLFISNLGQENEYHTITSTFCDIENEPIGIKRLSVVDCLFEQGSDPTRPARFVKILNSYNKEN